MIPADQLELWINLGTQSLSAHLATINSHSADSIGTVLERYMQTTVHVAKTVLSIVSGIKYEATIAGRPSDVEAALSNAYKKCHGVNKEEPSELLLAYQTMLFRLTSMAFAAFVEQTYKVENSGRLKRYLQVIYFISAGQYSRNSKTAEVESFLGQPLFLQAVTNEPAFAYNIASLTRVVRELFQNQFPTTRSYSLTAETLEELLSYALLVSTVSAADSLGISSEDLTDLIGRVKQESTIATDSNSTSKPQADAQVPPKLDPEAVSHLSNLLSRVFSTAPSNLLMGISTPPATEVKKESITPTAASATNDISAIKEQVKKKLYRDAANLFFNGLNGLVIKACVKLLGGANNSDSEANYRRISLFTHPDRNTFSENSARAKVESYLGEGSVFTILRHVNDCLTKKLPYDSDMAEFCGIPNTISEIMNKQLMTVHHLIHDCKEWADNADSWHAKLYYSQAAAFLAHYKDSLVNYARTPSQGTATATAINLIEIMKVTAGAAPIVFFPIPCAAFLLSWMAFKASGFMLFPNWDDRDPVTALEHFGQTIRTVGNHVSNLSGAAFLAYLNLVFTTLSFPSEVATAISEQYSWISFEQLQQRVTQPVYAYMRDNEYRALCAPAPTGNPGDRLLLCAREPTAAELEQACGFSITLTPPPGEEEFLEVALTTLRGARPTSTLSQWQTFATAVTRVLPSQALASVAQPTPELDEDLDEDGDVVVFTRRLGSA